MEAPGGSSQGPSRECSTWRCVVKPRMVIRSAASLDAAPHKDWLKGLSFGQEVQGRAVDGWVHLLRGGCGLIQHPQKGPLLQEVKGKFPTRPAPREGTAAQTANPSPPSFRLELETLQGRWRHSVAKMGLLTVRGHSIAFDNGNSFDLEEGPGCNFSMGGWYASHEKSSVDKIVWLKSVDSGELCCTWEQCRSIPVLFWGICDVKFDPRLPEHERIRVLELGDGRASKFSHHGAAITAAFERRCCMHPNPMKRSVLVDNKRLTHDVFQHARAGHLRPPTFFYPRHYSADLPARLVNDLALAEGGAAVLKLCNRSRGAGVVVITAETAQTVLQRLLTPPAAEELKALLRERGPDAVKGNTAFKDMLEEHCLHWWSNECPVFVAERCCHSLPMPLEPGSELVFDGTMRVAFALHREGDCGNEPFLVEWLGSYWKLPGATSLGGGNTVEELHNRIVSSFNSAEKRTAEVQKSHSKEVCDALTPYLPQIFEAGDLEPKLLASIYGEQPLFRAFALARVACSVRTYDVRKARALLLEAQVLAKADSGDKSSVLSYIERNLGVCCSVESRWVEAHEHWERAIQLMPTNATALYLDGCYWQVMGNHQRGIECIQESIVLDPDFRSAYIGLSDSGLLHGDFELAAEACLGCLRRFPDAVGAHLNLGQALYKMLQGSLGPEEALQKSKRAINAFEMARSKAPDLWTPVAEAMLAFCQADETARATLPLQEVFVGKIYGWRP